MCELRDKAFELAVVVELSLVLLVQLAILWELLCGR